MEVITSAGNRYFYQRNSNEISLSPDVDDSEEIILLPPERFNLMPNVDTFVICLTTKCNLRCVYCCYSGQYRNTRTHGNESFAAKENLNNLLTFIDNTAFNKQIHIIFYGGESIIEFDKMAWIVDVTENTLGERVRFSVSTNGTLLTQKIIDWAVRHNVTLNISIDGTQLYHDRYRKSATGEGSYLSAYTALSFIQSQHLQYFNDKINLLTTIYDFSELSEISQDWMRDAVLRHKPPKLISEVAANYLQDVPMVNEEIEKNTLLHLFDIFTTNPDNVVLRVFFNQMIWIWDHRPIYPIDRPINLQYCFPSNHKLYIDVNGDVGLCEKTVDTMRIGNIRDGIDWDSANKVAQAIYNKRKLRCGKCPILRVCDICPTALDLSDNEMDIFCHNQLVRFKLQLWLYCEMAEKEMI